MLGTDTIEGLTLTFLLYYIPYISGHPRSPASASLAVEGRDLTRDLNSDLRHPLLFDFEHPWNKSNLVAFQTDRVIVNDRLNQFPLSGFRFTNEYDHEVDEFDTVGTQYPSSQNNDRGKRNGVGVYRNTGLSQYTVANSSNSYKRGVNLPVNWNPRYALASGSRAEPDHQENYRIHKGKTVSSAASYSLGLRVVYRAPTPQNLSNSEAACTRDVDRVFTSGRGLYSSSTSLQTTLAASKEDAQSTTTNSMSPIQPSLTADPSRTASILPASILPTSTSAEIQRDELTDKPGKWDDDSPEFHGTPSSAKFGLSLEKLGLITALLSLTITTIGVWIAWAAFRWMRRHAQAGHTGPPVIIQLNVQYLAV